jgi:hypothetical protein
MDCINIDYFLFLKKKYISISSYLTEIINSYQELSLVNNDFLLQRNKYKKELAEIKDFINNINFSIYQLCQHEFVEDEIDLTPDSSQKIEYCQICECTKEYGFTVF